MFVFASAKAQDSSYWQQHVDYTMDVKMNVEDYNYTGTQKLVYTNNSPDTLDQVFTTCILMLFSRAARWICAPARSQIPIAA